MNPNTQFGPVIVPIPIGQNYVIVSGLNLGFLPTVATAFTQSGPSGAVIWASVDMTTLTSDGATFNLSGAPPDNYQTLVATFYGYSAAPQKSKAPPIAPQPTTLPPRRQPRGTTVSSEDVRHFMFDRNASDNALDLDLSFSEQDIEYAMRFTALRYNAIPPTVLHVHPNHLPFGETMLNGIAYYLYLGKLQQLMRNDVDYSAGNMTIDINKRRIESISKIMQVFKQAFEEQAKLEKISINLNYSYMQVG